MQKAKKMSKQTLVIAVLAVMLVLSLALSVTGAWFTDEAEATVNQTINFGTVAVGLTETENADDWTFEGGRTVQKILPGDSFTMGGDIDCTGTDVDIYVYIVVTDVTLKMGDVDFTEAIFGADAGAVTIEATGATAVENKTGMYTATSTSTFAYDAAVTVQESVGNTVVIGGTTYILNDNGTVIADAVVAENLVLSASVKVAAIQKDNITVDEAYTQLQALVNA